MREPAPPVLVFDLFGVIARHQSPESVAAIERAAGLSGPRLWRPYWDLRAPYDRGDQSGRDYWRTVARAAGTGFGDDQLDELVVRDLESWSEVDDEMVDLVGEMSGLTRLALLSNLPSDLAAHVEVLHRSWLDVFEVRAFSCRIGYAKPEAGAYTWCLEKLGVPASDTVFVDDRAENIRAAERLGMTGHLFTTLDDLRRALVEPYRIGRRAPAAEAVKAEER
ncbi:HAD family phosphatase [Streptosporangium sp. NPDC023615]|uniref:HAD family hydrolase n=1 Tax=Streptosporangium sp. NPDC023615 TaxID=3154794 RepID=UPI0034365BFC